MRTWLRPLPCVFLFAAGLATAGPVSAEQPDAAPSPEKVRFIDAEDATSACIGDASTPLCAVETLIACWARVEPALCSRVHDETPDPLPAPGLAPYRAEYKVRSVRLLEDKDMGGYLDIAGYRPGFAEVTLLRRFPDSDSAAHPEREWMAYYYYLKPVRGEGPIEGEWRVFAWNINFLYDAPPLEIRRMDRDSATSDCIGNMSSPLCAVETALACGLWREKEQLCVQAYGKPVAPGKSAEFDSGEYYLRGVHTVRPEDISNTLIIQKQTKTRTPGNVEVELSSRFRRPDGTTSPPEEWGMFECWLEPVAERWRLITCSTLW